MPLSWKRVLDVGLKEMEWWGEEEQYGEEATAASVE